MKKHTREKPLVCFFILTTCHTTHETTPCSTRNSKRLKIRKRLHTPDMYVHRLTGAHSTEKQGVCSVSDNGVVQVSAQHAPTRSRGMYRQRAGGVSPHLLCRGVPSRTYYVRCFFVPTCAQPCSLNNTLTSKCGCPDHFKWSPPRATGLRFEFQRAGRKGFGVGGVNKGKLRFTRK